MTIDDMPGERGGSRPGAQDAPPRRPIGALDDVEHGSRVAGWARIEGSADSVEVEIWVDDGVAGRATADQYRDDLDRNGWGDCAFWCDLPRDLLDGGEHLVDVRFATTGERLRHTPRTFVLEHRTGADRAADAGGLIGAFDGVEEGGWAAGWARRRSHAGNLSIDAWIDGALAGQVIADRPRDDLQRDDAGDCAFWFGIPDIMLDGQEHRIDLYYAGTDRPLPGSPQTFRIHRADPLLTDGVNLIATAAFDFWPNGLRLTPRERFAEIVSGWFYDFRRDAPPIVTIEADKPRTVDLPRHGYAMRITVEEGGSDAAMRLVVPIALAPRDLPLYRCSIGLRRSPSVSDDALHVSEIFVGALKGMAIGRIADVHGASAPRGAIRLMDLPAVGDPRALIDMDPDATLALVIGLRGDGVLTIFSPALLPSDPETA